jgi:hypothetical protein
MCLTETYSRVRVGKHLSDILRINKLQSTLVTRTCCNHLKHSTCTARTANCKWNGMRLCVQLFHDVLNKKQYFSPKKDYRLIFVMEMQCVFVALEYEFVNIILVKSVFQTARRFHTKG